MEGKYEKFNSNMGFVNCREDIGSKQSTLKSYSKNKQRKGDGYRTLVSGMKSLSLGAIIEFEEDEDEDDKDDDRLEEDVKLPTYLKCHDVNDSNFP